MRGPQGVIKKNHGVDGGTAIKRVADQVIAPVPAYMGVWIALEVKRDGDKSSREQFKSKGTRVVKSEKMEADRAEHSKNGWELASALFVTKKFQEEQLYMLLKGAKYKKKKKKIRGLFSKDSLLEGSAYRHGLSLYTSMNWILGMQCDTLLKRVRD